MVNLQLDWQQATGLGLVLVAARVAVARGNRVRVFAPYLQESAIIAFLYALWQLAGSISVVGTTGALARGRWIERVQREAGLPSERSLQHLVLGHPLLAQLCNLYYLSMHFGVLGIFLVWLFVRHRHRYPFVRNVLVAVTAACLVVQFVPVAPPRLLPGLGFVDVAARYGQSVYALSGITLDSLAAMPSVHVAWALLVAWGAWTVGTSRWRILGAVHAVVTVFVVVATGNHFWLDGIVAGLLLVLSVLGVRLVMRPDDADPGGGGVGEAGQRSGRLLQRERRSEQLGGTEPAVGNLAE